VILYLDTSAFVKRYVREQGSDEVLALIDQAELVGSSLLTRVEMASALAKASRMGWVGVVDAHKAWELFLRHWQAVTRFSVTPPLVERASTWAWDHGMRGDDSIHLASAIIWQETLEMPIVLATYDRELWLAARNVGMAAWPDQPAWAVS
jgi:predicted nucleic acid-binding protein